MQIALHHVAIQTAEFDVAYQFFTEFLGLEIVKLPFQFKERRLCLLRAGAIKLELYSHKFGCQYSPYSTANSGPTHIAFSVSDLDAFMVRCNSHNVRVLKQPFLPPLNGDKAKKRLAFIEGPDGQEIEVREIE